MVKTHSLLNADEMNNGLKRDEAPEYNEENPVVNRDHRLRATILYPGQGWDKFTNGFPSITKGSGDYWRDADNATHTGMNFKKFYSDPSEYPDIWGCDRNFPVLRYAEVLLSYAESKVELNEIDDSVYESMNYVR